MNLKQMKRMKPHISGKQATVTFDSGMTQNEALNAVNKCIPMGKIVRLVYVAPSERGFGEPGFYCAIWGGFYERT